MKKHYLFSSFICAAALLISCSKEPADNLEVNTPAKDTFEYVFRISDAEDSEFTKTTLDGSTVKWESDDKIGIFANGTTNAFGKITTLNPVEFPIYLKAALSADDMVYAYYPFSDANKSASASSINLEIPAVQTGDFDAMPQVALPYKTTVEMATGTTNTGELRFYNLGSVIRFFVYSSTGAYKNETVKTITFTPNKSAAGTFTFKLDDVDYADQSTLAISGYSEPSVTLTTSPSIGTTSSNAGTTEMVIAPDTYYGTIVLRTDVAKYTYTIAETNKLTFSRSKIKKIGLDLESATCTRVINSYEIPTTIDFKALSNVDYVKITGADYYSKNDSFFYGSCLRFDADDEQIIIPTEGAFGNISIVALYNTSNTPTSTLTIYGSEDGSSYSEIASPSFTHGANVTNTPDAVVISNSNNSYRYIKMVFTMNAGKLAVGSISIAAPDSTPRINVSDIEGVMAVGIANAVASYTVSNFSDDVTVSSVTGCVSDALADGGEIHYTVTANRTCNVRTGTIVLASSSNPSIVKTINVSQNASVFEASSTSPINFEWDDYTNAEIKRVTVTSTYELTDANVAISGTNNSQFEATITRNGTTDDYYLDLNVAADNEGDTDFVATVTVSRDEISIPIDLKQVHKGGSANVKGTTWSHALANGDLSDSGATKSWTSGLLTMSWSHSFTWESTTHYLTWVGGKTNHYQIGASSSRAMTSLSLSTSDYTDGIESVTITCSKASGSTVLIDVYVGDTKVASDEAVSTTGTTTAAQTITFDKVYKGSLRIDIKQSTSSKAFYLKALQIN